MMSEALKRVEYLREVLESSKEKLLEHSKRHAETCILTGKPSYMTLSCFDNLDRICREVEMAIKAEQDIDREYIIKSGYGDFLLDTEGNPAIFTLEEAKQVQADLNFTCEIIHIGEN